MAGLGGAEEPDSKHVEMTGMLARVIYFRNLYHFPSTPVAPDFSHKNCQIDAIAWDLMNIVRTCPLT